MDIGNPLGRYTFQPNPLASEHDLEVDRTVQVRFRGVLGNIAKGQAVEADVLDLTDAARLRRQSGQSPIDGLVAFCNATFSDQSEFYYINMLCLDLIIMPI